MDFSLISEMTFWQKMYLFGIIVGMALFVEIIGWITDECKITYKGFFKQCKLAIKTDFERSKTLWRNRHEKKRSS